MIAFGLIPEFVGRFPLLVGVVGAVNSISSPLVASTAMVVMRAGP